MPPASLTTTKRLFESKERDGFTLTVYRGSGTALIAFDLAKDLTNGLAGFAIRRTAPDKARRWLVNRLNFAQKLTAATTPEERLFTDSIEAPFQKFRWMDYPTVVQRGFYTYEAFPMYFRADGSLRRAKPLAVKLRLEPQDGDGFALGFTRGYLSSQAYARRFKNKPIRPPGPKTLSFDVKPYAKAWAWLGHHARDLVFDFLQEARAEAGTTLDVFAYDLDEPQIVKRLEGFGPRLRLLLDDSDHHTDDGAVEPEAFDRLRASAGPTRVKQGHFRRFSHHKVFLVRKGGAATRVLCGSANWSVRGLYVQSNNVLRFDDARVAGLFAEAFDEAWSDMRAFPNAEISQKWHKVDRPGVPPLRVAFSPHGDPETFLGEVSKRIRRARSSVLYAVMELDGSGSVLAELKRLRDRSDVLSYGVTQNDDGDLTVYKPGDATGAVAEFAYLKEKVPAPFQAEFAGGSGQVIHHKFVVCDFNDERPFVYTGSSNLAAGGERENGDHLFEIRDPEVATHFAVEAVRLFDHYHFRTALKEASDVKPLTLQGPDPADAPWYAPYYDKAHIKYHDRKLFAGGPD